MSLEAKTQKALDRVLAEIGPSEAVSRWLSKYGNLRTRMAYATQLVLYLRWMRARGVKVSGPDALIVDNLTRVFKSEPMDVASKRKHTDFLNEYVNDYLVKREASESKRTLAAVAVRSFYQRNDSPLFGDYKTASQDVEPPTKPLFPEDIRKVLMTLLVRDRTPLLIIWQSGLEPSRVFSAKFPTDKAPPVKVEIFGRKNHKQAHFTFLGRDSIEHLRTLGPRGFSSYNTVFKHLKETARRLGEKGVLKNPEPESWHPYGLRHSFSTEASHAKVMPEAREFWMGHISGIKWVYLHPELHEEDMAEEYGKLEPYVSLNPDGATIRSEYEKREASLNALYEDAVATLEKLKVELRASGVLSPAPQPEG